MTDSFRFGKNAGYRSIISDGEKLAVAMDENVVAIEKPVVTDCQVSIHQDRIDVTQFGSDHQEFIAGPRTIEMTIRIIGTGISFEQFNEKKMEANVKEFIQKAKTFKRSLDF